MPGIRRGGKRQRSGSYTPSPACLVGLATLPVAGYVGGFACVLNFGDIPPGIRLAAVEIGEAVDLRQLPAGQRLSVPARHVGVLREGRYGPADERWTLGNCKVGHLLCRVMPVRFGDAISLEHGL